MRDDSSTGTVCIIREHIYMYRVNN